MAVGNKTFYYTLMHSLTEIQPCRIMPVQGIPVCKTNSALTVSHILLSLFSYLSSKITKNNDTFTVDYNFYL